MHGNRIDKLFLLLGRKTYSQQKYVIAGPDNGATGNNFYLALAKVQL